MPWYYAGPEAKPVGPISLEELQDLKVKGVISPETYVIESTGPSSAPVAWKRFREVFMPSPGLPPVPALPTTPPPPPPSLVVEPHPLFPSAGLAPTPHHQAPPLPTASPVSHATHKTNIWCGWGFGLGLAGFFLSFACGVGLLLALPALIICIVGLLQVHKHRDQSGQGLAIAGLLLSGVAVLVSIIFIVALAVPFIRNHEQTVMEQSTNDSE